MSGLEVFCFLRANCMADKVLVVKESKLDFRTDFELRIWGLLLSLGNGRIRSLLHVAHRTEEVVLIMKGLVLTLRVKVSFFMRRAPESAEG